MTHTDITDEQYTPDRPSCDGTGVISVECSGRHPWICGMGNPDCDDTEMDCPGCADCEVDPDRIIAWLTGDPTSPWIGPVPTKEEP